MTKPKIYFKNGHWWTTWPVRFEPLKWPNFQCAAEDARCMKNEMQEILNIYEK